MNKTLTHAEKEFDILEQTVDSPIIMEFKDEILSLVSKFGDSGQSGGSAPYTAGAIARAVRTLCMQNPLCGVQGDESEWNEVCDNADNVTTYQNNRLSSVFKKGIDGDPYYLDAIIFSGEEEYDTFTGSVYIDDIDFILIGSRQFINIPFIPKTYYVDIIRVSINKEEAETRHLHYIENDDGCYYSILKDPSQLDDVFKYYNRVGE